MSGTLKQDKESWFNQSRPLYFFYDSSEAKHFLSEDDEEQSLLAQAELNPEESRKNIPYLKKQKNKNALKI